MSWWKVSGGKVDDAIAQFREAVKLKPDYSEAYNDLAIALLKKGAVEDAIAHLREKN